MECDKFNAPRYARGAEILYSRCTLKIAAPHISLRGAQFCSQIKDLGKNCGYIIRPNQNLFSK